MTASTGRTAPTYELFYWPEIQGRGEFVRLLLEQARADYEDVARTRGVEAIERLLNTTADDSPVFAVPVLRIGDMVLSQSANICMFLARRHQLVSHDQHSRLRANQVQLTIADVVTEVHDTHHPIAVGETYEAQRDAARRRARQFVDRRMPKFLDYLDRLLAAGDGDWMMGPQPTYVDLSTFQLIRGLEYAFPEATADYRTRLPALFELTERVAERPSIAAYLDSPRRLPFNEDGIFRHYPELDAG